MTGRKDKTMTRQQKYPDTDTFKFYNHNPKNRITGDCAIRAISFATEIPYNDVVMGLAKLQCETGFDSIDCISKYMKSIGWVKHSQPRKYDGRKYTGSEFCLQVAQKKERIVANIGGHHMVAIVNGRVHDIWNSTDGCIGNYWTRG